MDQLHTQAYYSRETLLANKCGREQGSKNEKKEKQYQKNQSKPKKNHTHPQTKKKQYGIYVICIFSVKLALAQTWKQTSQTEANAQKKTAHLSTDSLLKRICNPPTTDSRGQSKDHLIAYQSKISPTITARRFCRSLLRVPSPPVTVQSITVFTFLWWKQ